LIGYGRPGPPQVGQTPSADVQNWFCNYYHLCFKVAQAAKMLPGVTGKGAALSKKAKITNRKTIHIEWGDCDPAQIVHYPRYLAYFDACTTALFKRAGLSKRQMLKTYQIIGIPMVDLHVSFKVPSRFSDTVIVDSEVTEWRRSSFCIRHRLFNKRALAVECLEIRVWAAVSETDPERIESKPVPREVIERFSADRPIQQKSRRKKR
jgi:4-hydroxybenzoyl-CoA thioesterase